MLFHDCFRVGWFCNVSLWKDIQATNMGHFLHTLIYSDELKQLYTYNAKDVEVFNMASVY